MVKYLHISNQNFIGVWFGGMLLLYGFIMVADRINQIHYKQKFSKVRIWMKLFIQVETILLGDDFDDACVQLVV